jgi:ABC-2 type transport system ATP-binding protein
MSKNNSLSKESKVITSFDDNKIKEALLYLKDEKILSEFEYNQKINSLNVRQENIDKRSMYQHDDHEVLISVINLTKQYKNRKQPAVDNVSFDIRRGEFHVFIGANGAGKTTTIKAIVGAYANYSGEILIDGHKNSTVAAKRKIGYVPEVAIFPKEFTTKNYLESMSIMSGLSKSEAKDFSKDTLSKINMLELINKKPSSFSSGQKKKILLAQAMVHNPDILIMDEPAANLDPLARLELFKTLDKYKNAGKSIFISSHILSEVGKYADTATILDGGKIVFHGRLDGTQNLDELYSKHVVLGSVDTSEAKTKIKK